VVREGGEVGLRGRRHLQEMLSHMIIGSSGDGKTFETRRNGGNHETSVRA
jgi:hypothetical protein